MLGRNNKFQLADWMQIFEAVQGSSNLRELCDFDWSALLLAPDTTEFKVMKDDLGKKHQIMALNALLPRVAGSLTKLILRCVMLLL
jgi:hypothetical protein